MNKKNWILILALSIFLLPVFNISKVNADSAQNLPSLQNMLAKLPAPQGFTKSQIIARYNRTKSSKSLTSKKISKSLLSKKAKKPAVLPPSKIENMYYRLYHFGKPLVQFGYNFFYGRKIKPTIVGAVGNNYIVGPGDSLSIYVSGAPAEVLGIPNSFKDLKVNREGMINIPFIGTMYVWGKSLGEVNKIIAQKFSKRFKNVSVNVSLDKLRQFTVYVSGFVKKPGAVLVNGTYSVLDALTLAGGVSREGSLRNIIVREDINGVIKNIHVDLYKLLLSGLPVNTFLYQGDVIYVPPIGKTVAVKGSVKRPAIYEIKPGTTIKQVIKMAGGLEFYSRKENIKTIKLSNGQFKISTANLANANFLNKKVQNGQVIIVGSTFSKLINNEITVSGDVAYPGIYSTKTTPTLKSLIKKIVLLKNTNLNFAQVVRKYKNKIIIFSPKDVLDGKFNIRLHTGEKIIFYPKWIVKPIEISGYGITGPSFIEYYKGLTLLSAFKNIRFKISPKDLKAYIFSNAKINKLHLFPRHKRKKSN
ncbi:MAG: SLBB domain-containing protein, partial [Candidatus Acidulodesulfobacterium sp.]